MCALALLMAIPAGFVWMIFYSRAIAAQAAIYEVAALRAGSQNLMGPAITVPFDRDVVITVNNVNQVQTRTGRMVLYAETGAANAELATEIRKRGLHEVPTYHGERRLQGDVRSCTHCDRGAIRRTVALERSAHPHEHVSDLRGAKDARITLGGQPLDVAPVEIGSDRRAATIRPSTLRLLGARLAGRLEPCPGTLSGDGSAERHGRAAISALAAFARDTTIELSGDWGSPSFDGGVLPDQRRSDEGRLHGEWRIPFLARGVPGAGADLSFDTL